MKKTLSLLARLLTLLAMITSPHLALANITGPYTADTNTLFLLHFDEPAGTSTITNYGSKGGFFYTVANTTSGNGGVSPTTAMLGQPGYVDGATNFNMCVTNPAAGDFAGYDFNRSGAYDPDVSSSSLSPDAMAMTNLNIGFGGQSPFTIEALIRPAGTTTPNQEIVCTDSSAGSRAFQFRITSGNLQFQFINGNQAFSGTIPTTGNDAFVDGNWYHVALTYDGTNATLYWTLLNPTNGAAHVLSTAVLALGTTQGATTGPLTIGNENRNSSQEQFQGCIDEVRISNVARGSGQMQFYSPLVSITQTPVSQNIDYNQPVTFSVGAASQFALSYQWRFNSNSIAGATNISYGIPNVAASNAGYYDCVVSNTADYASVSSEARLVVGAANFLADRYSFTTDTTDSIGGQTGTNFGDAYVTNGTLVLDGTSGTFMQLPANLFNSANATALTVEFWATYGTNPDNVYVFALGVTNYVTGSGIVGFNCAVYSPHNAGGQEAFATPGDPQFSQTVTAAGNLDGQYVHVAVVIDAPDKSLLIYTNGVLEAANTNFTVNISSLNDQFSYIGRSLWAADPYLNASIDELRIFRGALSAITIQQSEVQGPNVLLADGPGKFVLQPAAVSVPLGQVATFSAAAVGYLPINYQWFKNNVPIPGATNAIYSYVPTLADNNTTFFVQATNTIGLTTYVTNSSTVTLSVFVPPTLSWLGTEDGGVDNNWNTTSLDWTNDLTGGGIVAFAQTNGVLFDDRSGGGSVDVEQTIIPYNIKVNTTDGYMFTSYSALGSLSGQASLTKLGSGTLNLDLTNSLTGPVLISAGELQIGNNDSLGSLGSGSVTNNGILSINRSDTALNVGNLIQGPGTLSFDGSGATTLSGNNTYTGSTLLNNGIVFLTSSTGLGATPGVAVANGAQLYITANINVAQPLTLNGVGDGNGALHKGGAGITTNSSVLMLASDSTIGVDSGATLVLNNSVAGIAALTANGAGTLALNTANNYPGGTTLAGAIIDFNANGALGTGEVTVSGASRLVLANGVNFTNFLDASDIAPGVGFGLLMVNDNTNNIVTTVSGPLEFDNSPGSGGDFVGPTTSGYLNITGPITNDVTGEVSMRSGFVRFAGGGNYSTFDLTGTASLGANNGLSTNATLAVGVSTTGTFDLNGFNQTLSGLIDGATFSELITNSTTTPATFALDLSGAYTYSGVIGGNVALVLNGAGNWYLAGTNTYTGNTTVNGGTLELAQPALNPYSSVTVASGATLQLDFSVTNTVSTLVLNGVSQPLGVYNNNSSPSFISGSGSLQVAVTIASNPTPIITSVSGSTLNLSWPADHLGWILQSQTNSLAVGFTTNWVDVAGSGSSTTATITINPAKPAVFYRLRHP